MDKRVLSIREESTEEKKLREWFEDQALEGPKTVEDAARLLIGLVTGLLGALFGVLAISAEKLPGYLSLPLVRWAGVAAVILWLLSLLAGLVVVLPRKWQTYAGKPDTQSQVFLQILAFKSGWLTTCVLFFGMGILGLGVVLVVALLSV